MTDVRNSTVARVGFGLTSVALLACAWLAGVGLVGAIFVLEALLVGVVAVRGWRPFRLRAAAGLVVCRPSRDPEWLSPRVATLALIAITGVGLALRLIGIDTDLWTDEIVTVRQFASLTPFQIFHDYGAANNHLLNSVLVHASIASFGYEEWAIRLPALIAGVLTVPATYALARLVNTRLTSLVASAAVAVAYQHIFFSQNARGYASMMLFAIVSTTALLRALEDDGVRHWLIAIPSAVACVASVPTGAFVLAAQILVVAALLLVAARSGREWRGVAWHAGLAFTLVGLIVLQLYAGVLASAGVADAAWKGDVGARPLSSAFLAEVGRSAGIGASTGVSILSVLLVLVGLIGLVSLARRGWPVLACLVLGPCLHLAFAIANGLTFSPRFLALWLFPTVLVALETLGVVRRRCLAAGHVATGRFVAGAGAVCLCLALAAPSRLYLGEPKQEFTRAILDAEQRADGGMVVGVETAENAVRYYGAEHPVGRELVEGRDFAIVRSSRQFTAVERAAGRRPIVLLTTFAPDLDGIPPPLASHIRSGWRVARVYPGTLPHGDVVVWVRIAR